MKSERLHGLAAEDVEKPVHAVGHPLGEFGFEFVPGITGEVFLALTQRLRDPFGLSWRQVRANALQYVVLGNDELLEIGEDGQRDLIGSGFIGGHMCSSAIVEISKFITIANTSGHRADA